MVCIEEIKDWLKNNLTDERYHHSLGCANTCKLLAEKFGYDPERAYLAGLVHDCAKNLNFEKMVELTSNMALEEGECCNTKILHAPAGAVLAKQVLGLDDEELLSAVRWHTLGRVDMSLLEKIVFLSDKIEPETRCKEECERLWQLLELPNGLERAILECYAYTVKSLVDRKLVICNKTVEIYNSLVRTYAV